MSKGHVILGGWEIQQLILKHNPEAPGVTIHVKQAVPGDWMKIERHSAAEKQVLSDANAYFAKWKIRIKAVRFLIDLADEHWMIEQF